MKKKLFALSLAAMLSLSACGGPDTEPTPSQTSPESAAPGNTAKELVMGSVGYFPNSGWDPAQGWEGWFIESYGVAETLFRLDENYTALPWLATSAEQVDALNWKVTLRDNVLFHNGAPMTAEAVKKCFERTMEISDRSDEVIPIDTLTADGQTLTITLTSPAPNLINNLTDPLFVVYDADGSEDFLKETFFTGPYIPVEFAPNDVVVVEPFDDYWGDAPQLDKVTLKTIADVDALNMAFQNGEVDIVVPLPDSSIPLFQGKEGLVIDSRTSARVQLFRFNFARPMMQDPALRNAIAYCVDREGYAKAICHDLVQPCYGLFPEQMSYGGTEGLELTVDHFDPEAAKKLLTDAGYTDTNGDGILEKDGAAVELTMIALASQTAQVQLCEVLQDQLNQIGIKMDLQVLENINDARSGGQFDISCESFTTAGTGVPNTFITQMYSTNGSANYGKYSDPEVDALIEALENLEDPSKQNELIRQISQLVLDDCAYINFGYKKFTGMYNTETVANYWSQPSEYYILDSSTAAK